MGFAVALGVLLIVLGWFFWPGSSRPAPSDNAELDAAERDVQEAADQDSVRDWGPGTGQKPLP